MSESFGLDNHSNEIQVGQPRELPNVTESMKNAGQLYLEAHDSFVARLCKLCDINQNDFRFNSLMRVVELGDGPRIGSMGFEEFLNILSKEVGVFIDEANPYYYELGEKYNRMSRIIRLSETKQNGPNR